MRRRAYELERNKSPVVQAKKRAEYAARKADPIYWARECERKLLAMRKRRAAGLMRESDEASREKVKTRRKLVPREATIESYLRDRVLALDGLCLKFNDTGQRGAPDRLVVLHGRPTYYVELKRPHLGVLANEQKRYHERLRARGQRVWVLWSKADVDAFITEVELT